MKLALSLVVLSLLPSLAFTQKIKIEYQRGYLHSEFIYSLAERPTPECHASTLEETGDGILAAWFGGTEEGHPDVGIWTARYKDQQWSEPVKVATGFEGEKRYPCWNPVLFQPRQGPLMLFYKVGPNPREWWGMLITSTDNGHTWSEAKRMPDGFLGPIKNKPIQLENGDILCGSSTEDNGWQVHFEITSDLGKTWEKVGPVNNPKRFDAIQPTILKYKTSRAPKYQALCRSRQNRITEVWSEDRAQSWSRMQKTKLPNPNSGIDGVTLDDWRQFLVYNHTTKGRSPLDVAQSKNGKRWKQILRLEEDKGEYSYPAIIQASDGLVYITYTWNRQTIKFVIVDPARI